MTEKAESKHLLQQPNPIRFSKEMGITHAEFFRILPAAIAGRSFTLQPREVLIVDGDRWITITLSEAHTRILGSIRLPKTEVSFTFSGYSKQEVERFMVQFNLHFQRGGG